MVLILNVNFLERPFASDQRLEISILYLLVLRLLEEMSSDAALLIENILIVVSEP